LLSHRGKALFPQNTKMVDTKNEITKQVCCFVRKCIDGNVCEDFANYFHVNEHEIGTRNKGHLITLPKVRLNVAKDSFFFMGSKVYNMLPLEIRKEKSFDKFKLQVKEFYM